MYEKQTSSQSVLVEEITSAFAPGLKIQIWQREGDTYCIFDFNKWSTHTGQWEPMKFWNYNSMLLLNRLTNKTLDRMSYWHFDTKAGPSNASGIQS